MTIASFFTGCTVQPAPPKVEQPTKPAPPAGSSMNEINYAIDESACSRFKWKDRDRGPKAYYRGMAQVFARSVCDLQRSDVKAVAAKRTSDDLEDVLSWYNSNFKDLGMTNDVAGVDTLRHVYALLIGLGMRESSGKHCCGRDMSADFSSASSAEAGLFQASWGSRKNSKDVPRSPEFEPMFELYKAGKRGCMLDVFSKGVSCSAGDAKNWGDGDGKTWQEFSKQCPAFSVEWAAVLVRVHGGSKGEFGPFRQKKAELRKECDDMLLSVQKSIEANPEICKTL